MLLFGKTSLFFFFFFLKKEEGSEIKQQQQNKSRNDAHTATTRKALTVIDTLVRKVGGFSPGNACAKRQREKAFSVRYE